MHGQKKGRKEEWGGDSKKKIPGKSQHRNKPLAAPLAGDTQGLAIANECFSNFEQTILLSVLKIYRKVTFHGLFWEAGQER